MPSTALARLDAHITGNCWPWNRRVPAVARCNCGYRWPTIAHHDCGTVELTQDWCPECGGACEDYEVDDGDGD